MPAPLPIHAVTFVTTTLGTFCASFSVIGLSQLAWADENAPAEKKASHPRVKTWTKQLQSWLSRYAEGKPTSDIPPLDLTCGTTFQVRVWRALQEISFGEIKTYSWVGETVKKPGALRAIGSACGANPIPLLIPCHRVLRSDGNLGGFAWGLARKESLLVHEGWHIVNGQIASNSQGLNRPPLNSGSRNFVPFSGKGSGTGFGAGANASQLRL